MKIHTKLSDAILEKTKIWTQDINIYGAKRFHTGSIENFIKMYDSLSVKNFHEHVAGDLPCNPYFDIDICYAKTPDYTYETATILTTKIVDLCKVILKEHTITEYIADSSNDKKFSQHIILHINDGKSMLKNHIHCKALAELVIQKIPQSANSIDTQIYTTNHMLRILYSSKYNEHRPFVPLNSTHTLLDFLIQPHIASHLIELPSLENSVQVTSTKWPSIIHTLARYLANHWASTYNTRSIKVTPIFYDSLSQIIRYTTNCSRCLVLEQNSTRTNHNTQNIKFVVDLKNGSFQQYCHSKKEPCYANNRHRRSNAFDIKDLSTKDYDYAYKTQICDYLMDEQLFHTPTLELYNTSF